jgi:hypothetical protein
MPYLPSSVRSELDFPGLVQTGAKGMKARRVQEWLTFHDEKIVIDADFGDATETAVRAFQSANGLSVNGRVDQKTWDALVDPMRTAVSATVPQSSALDAAILKVARAHLKVHPIELGGENLGPWVRAYCGSDGAEMKWCAGFVSFVIRQACELTGAAKPIPGSLSCDSLAYQARQGSRFVSGVSIGNGQNPWSSLGTCQVFLVRHSATDWTHTGFSFEGDDQVFSTIEGNTNDDGSANGYEVCQRSRSLMAKDFIRLT